MKKNKWQWYFIWIVFVVYFLVFFFSKEKFYAITDRFVKLIFEFIPMFFLIFVLLFLTNYFVDVKTLKKYLWEEAGLKWWIISILWWIISVWPSYARYPLLEGLKKKWIKSRYIATFIYNRWIKLHFYPILIMYFGLTYSLILLLVMVVFSIPQWLIVEKLEETL